MLEAEGEREEKVLEGEGEEKVLEGEGEREEKVLGEGEGEGEEKVLEGEGEREEKLVEGEGEREEKVVEGEGEQEKKVVEGEGEGEEKEHDIRAALCASVLKSTVSEMIRILRIALLLFTIFPIISSYLSCIIAGTMCRVIYGFSFVTFLAFMATALALMIYCFVEIEQTNILEYNVLSSNSEVYSLNVIEHGRNNNFSLFTHEACIERIDTNDFEDVIISLEKQCCAEVSTKRVMRTITSSVTSFNESEKVLEFYWIKNTNFFFNLTLSFSSLPDPEVGEYTVYLDLLDDTRLLSDCGNEVYLPPPTALKFGFPYSTNSSSSKVNCTRVNDSLLICELSHIVNKTGRYYMCMVLSKGPQQPIPNYKLEVNEVRHDVNDPEAIRCRLNESNCCSTFGDILQEAANPSCVFIRTESLEGDKKAKPLRRMFKIFTQKKWDGVFYSLYLIIIISVFPVIGLSLCCYTRYRKHHPRYCCQITCTCSV